jgi:mxaA protein
MIKKTLYACGILIVFCLCSFSALALETEFLPDIKEGIVSLNLTDPERDVGYTVGDVLTRNMIISIKKPYKLVDESLPIIGYERRYKGQLIGVDLSALTHTKEEKGNLTLHTISLSYQVFTNNVVAKPAALPAEFLRIINTETKQDNVFRYRIPSWNFAVSPLSVFGQVKVESDMSGYRGPLTLDNQEEHKRLSVLLPVLGLSLLGLLYMLGKHAWLPKMGGPFAKSFKTIKQATANQQGLEQAMSSVHKALNMSAGYSLFNNNTAQFMAKKPSFAHLKAEFNQFFALSNQVFFEPKSLTQTPQQSLDWLLAFTKQCRHCERGLIPDSTSTSGNQ